MTDLHPQLAGRLKHHLGPAETLPPSWKTFLDAVNDDYWQATHQNNTIQDTPNQDAHGEPEELEPPSGHEQELEESLSLLRATLESTADGILVVDLEGRIRAYNRRFAEMWDLPSEILATRDDHQLTQHALEKVADPENFMERVWTLYDHPDTEGCDLLELNDGRYFERFSMPQRIAGRSVGRVWSFRDVTRAYHDDLTGLPNRPLFKDRLMQALGQARRTRRPLAILFLDLDRFKMINDTLGYETGDRLLEEVARRLLSRQRAGDTVARLGGDEFLFLVQNLRHAEDAAKVARGLQEVLRPPIPLGDHELYVTASIGISLSPHDGDDLETLIKNADVAMYRAKDQGRDRYQLYAPEMNARALEILMVENGLRRALERDELIVHYQPQVEVGNGRVVGTEALLRWQQADGHLVAPTEFVGIAEDTGQIAALSEWVMKTACRQVQKWREAGLPPLRLAVNISARQLQSRGFLETVSRTLARSGLEPRALELELTESAIMLDPELGIAHLTALADMGVRIAVDDFGTGHSALAYLKRLPIHTLKIDRSFVNDCRSEATRDGAIVASIIALAHSLGLEVVGEGVEREDQWTFLAERGCDVVQGFYFSPAIDAAAFEALLREPAAARLNRWSPPEGDDGGSPLFATGPPPPGHCESLR